MKNRSIRLILAAFALVVTIVTAHAAPLDYLEEVLRNKPQVQEKVYVHTDNSAYFIGDTLWYKAYVVRADNLKPTNMSKLLYVELLTPDGYLVERQHVVVSDKGYTCGQFVLEDSLYSGYYEIRAYTRWQLNFNVTERDFTRDDKLKFYGTQAAKDFFRDWEGLYSRVLPVYQKPTEQGNYEDRYMSHRPKTRVLKTQDELTMSFYPEGGQLIEGLPCNLAYELKDNHGERIDIQGSLSDGTQLKVQHLGTGQVTITPTTTPLKATYTWKGHTYTFKLPKAQTSGVTLCYDATTKTVKLGARGVQPAAYAVMCRGRLQIFSRFSSAETSYSISLAAEKLTTGVNEIIIYDESARPLASRLFFINNGDYGKEIGVTLATADGNVDGKTTLQPYSPLDLMVSAGAEHPATVSVAVRDAQTDERGYDDGNIMTDMLLSSELKGFIAYPAYYFEKDDARHTADLDLLMKVQGWRRYKRAKTIRYMPERGLTFEGKVMTLPEFADMLELSDLENGGLGNKAQNMTDKLFSDLDAMNNGDVADISMASEYEENTDEMPDYSTDETDVEWADLDESMLGSGRLAHGVLVEAEINKDGEVAGAITRTDKHGHFLINLPPFYDKAYLFAKAFAVKDSATKCMAVMRSDKDWANERAYPDYLVRRDMWYPIYSQPYSWYQVNAPELQFIEEDDDGGIPATSSLAGVHQLKTVVVRAKRRGRRAINKEKPAIVIDAYRLYNDMTDYGLMLGVCDFKRFPQAAATFLCGNMGRRNQFNIRCMVNGTSFYRNYTPTSTEYDKNASSAAIFSQLHLNRLDKIQAYTDYEIRTDTGDVVNTNVADLTLDFIPIENDAKRPTYRDRRYVLDGLTYAEEFYSPDYSGDVPQKPTDYRRTLYWNPNARLDADGTFRARIYNNCRETRVTVSAVGLDGNGQMYYNVNSTK